MGGNHRGNSQVEVIGGEVMGNHGWKSRAEVEAVGGSHGWGIKKTTTRVE